MSSPIAFVVVAEIADVDAARAAAQVAMKGAQGEIDSGKTLSYSYNISPDGKTLRIVEAFADGAAFAEHLANPALDLPGLQKALNGARTEVFSGNPEETPLLKELPSPSFRKVLGRAGSDVFRGSLPAAGVIFHVVAKIKDEAVVEAASKALAAATATEVEAGTTLSYTLTSGDGYFMALEVFSDVAGCVAHVTNPALAEPLNQLFSAGVEAPEVHLLNGQADPSKTPELGSLPAVVYDAVKKA